MKVDLSLETKFERDEDASNFYRALLPDFKDVISIEGRKVVANLIDLTPSRARALANSLLRLIQLYQSVSELR